MAKVQKKQIKARRKVVKATSHATIATATPRAEEPVVPAIREEKPKRNVHRLTLFLTQDVFRRLRMASADRGQTMTALIEELVLTLPAVGS